jgi:uncharacterized protein (UPF0333 family)
MLLKLLKQKKCKILEFLLLTMDRVSSAGISGNFPLIGEYSSTVKNRRKCMTV